MAIADHGINTDLGTPGLAKFTVLAPTTPIAAGVITLVNLAADVPRTAPYGAKEILSLNLISVNTQAANNQQTDSALHVVGYFGDASGNAAYETLDVEKIQRIVVQADTGFAAWSQIDPLIVADINASGAITSIDASRVFQELSGNDRPEIPPIPKGIGPITFNGPDPLVSLPQSLAAMAGSLVTVPVNLDDATGLESAQFRLAYDANALQLVEVRRGSLTQDFPWLIEKHDTNSVSLDLSGPQLAGGSGSLAELVFRVLPGAPATLALDLQSASLNTGWLTLNPAPQPGADATDGVVEVTRPAAQEHTAETAATVGLAATQQDTGTKAGTAGTPRTEAKVGPADAPRAGAKPAATLPPPAGLPDGLAGLPPPVIDWDGLLDETGPAARPRTNRAAIKPNAWHRDFAAGPAAPHPNRDIRIALPQTQGR